MPAELSHLGGTLLGPQCGNALCNKKITHSKKIQSALNLGQNHRLLNFFSKSVTFGTKSTLFPKCFEKAL